jgi:putative transposase
MERIQAVRGVVPKRIEVDNEGVHLEGVGQVGLHEYQVTPGLLSARKPTDNLFIESFNGSFRDE